MTRHVGRLIAAGLRAVAWSPWSRRQRRYLALLVCAALFACLHFMTGSGRQFSAEQRLLGTAGESGQDPVDTGYANRLDDFGGVALWPPPPSPRQAALALQYPYRPGHHPSVPDTQQHKGTNGTANDVIRVGAPPTSSNSRVERKRSPAPFPWPVRRNFIPNYFLNYDNSSSSGNGKHPNQLDAGGILVYLHHNKAAGTTTKRCLATLAGAGLGRSTGPVLSSEGRLAVESRFARNRLFMLRSSPNTYYGGYAFGLCDRYISRPCAYFTVMRDPYERTLSSHSYCKHARQDQLCSAQNAGRVSLREWALHQGSFFFRQLLFQPGFCSDKTRWMDRIEPDAAPHDFVKKYREPWRGAPCWFREKLIMELTLNRTESEALLQYCLDNLERWFTVIMLVDRYDESLRMAQEALKLPMYKLCAGRHDNSGSYNKSDNPVISPKLINRTGGADSTSNSRDAVQAQLLKLRQDPTVRLALRADQLLYQKGVEIFNKQRQIFNSIRPPT